MISIISIVYFYLKQCQDISNICSDVWETTLTTDGCMDKGPNESIEEDTFAE